MDVSKLFDSGESTYQEIWDKEIVSKVYNKDDLVLVIDGDMLIYRVAAASDQRSILATKNGFENTFKTRTEFREYCKSFDEDYDSYDIADVVETEPLSYCLATIKRAVRNVQEKLKPTHTIILIGGSNNFRLKLPLPEQYKSSRKSMLRPVHLEDCQKYVLKHYNSYKVCGVEADDVVQGLTQYINNQTEARSIAYNIDKDFRQSLLPNQMYNPTTERTESFKGGVGELKDKFKGNGLKFLMEQVCLFDKIDCYCMNAHYLKRYGETSFIKDFNGFKTEKDVLGGVVNLWNRLLPEKTEFVDFNGIERSFTRLELGEVYFSCAYMKTSPTDDTTLKGLLDKYGVDYDS